MEKGKVKKTAPKQEKKYYSDNDRGCMLHKGRMPTY